MGRILKVDHTRYKRKDTEDSVDNAVNLGDSGGDDDSDQAQAGRRKRRPMRDNGGAKDGRSTATMDKDLGMLVEDYDEDDPMKEYLARQKEDIKNGMGRHRKDKTRTGEDGESRQHRRHHHRRHRRDSEKNGDRHVRQVEHRHQPKSMDRSEDASRENFGRRTPELDHDRSSSRRRRE